MSTTKVKYPCRRDGKRDHRYGIAPEFNGARSHQVWVVRFCGEYLGWADEQELAEDIARYHADTGSDRSPLIPPGFPLQPLPPEQVWNAPEGSVHTCPKCLRSWAVSADPAPADVCPFEVFH